MAVAFSQQLTTLGGPQHSRELMPRISVIPCMCRRASWRRTSRRGPHRRRQSRRLAIGIRYNSDAPCSRSTVYASEMERAVLSVRLLLPLQCVAAIRLQLSFALLSLALHSAREFAKNVPKPKVALKKDEDAIAADPSELDLLSMQASSDTRCLAFTWSVCFRTSAARAIIRFALCVAVRGIEARN